MAQAAPLSDPASGLSVDPPPGYAARVETPDRRQAARFSIRRATETDGGCELAFSASPANARMTQPQINAAVESPEGQEAAKSALAAVYDVLRSGTVNVGPVRGLEVVADFKRRPELPARARQLRSYFMILETPRGRTTLVCVTDQASFPARYAEFADIAQRTTPP